MNNRTEHGWPICPFDRRRPHRKVSMVTTPEYERQMRELKCMEAECDKLEFLVKVYEINDREEA